MSPHHRDLRGIPPGKLNAFRDPTVGMWEVGTNAETVFVYVLTHCKEGEEARDVSKNNIYCEAFNNM